MTTLYTIVENFLRHRPYARERRNKDYALAALLSERYGLGDRITAETLVAVLQEYGSMDRYWRKALLDNTELRGEDYDTKDKVEHDKLEELGYNVGMPKEMDAAETEIRQPQLL